jgi:hypothetical protein
MLAPRHPESSPPLASTRAALAPNPMINEGEGTMKRDIYREITDQIVRELESGTAP